MIGSSSQPLTVSLCDSQATAEQHFTLRGRVYAKHYRNIEGLRFSDEFDECSAGGQRRSSLIGVKRADELVGTCRLIQSLCSGNVQASEIVEIFEIQWSALADEIGVGIHELSICELGKFAVEPGPMAHQAKRLLLKAAGEMALQWKSNYVMAVMTPTVERTASSRSGAKFHRLSNRLRRDNRKIKQRLLRYYDYFLPEIGKTGLHIDPSFLESLSDQSLDLLLTDCADGPALWWITAESLANLSCD